MRFNTPVHLLILGTIGSLVLTASPVRADVILSPVSVLNAVPSFPGCCAIQRTIDRSGLSVGFTTGVTDFDAYLATGPSHSTSIAFEWFSPAGTFSQDINYDLGAVYSVSRLAFWNEESQGTTSVSVFASNDPLFAASIFLGTFFPTNWPITPYLADVFDTTDAIARYIRLSVVGTPGFDGDGAFNQGVSAGEVAFAVAPAQVPEPVPQPVPESAALTLIGIGVSALALRRRRISIARDSIPPICA